MKGLFFNPLSTRLNLALTGLPFAQHDAGWSAEDLAELQKLHAMMTFVRNRSAQEYAVTTPTGIDYAKYVDIGGIKQWITIRGENRNNPILLFLHGGPGDATNPWGYAGFRRWLKNFTFAQWDQRGSGRTLGMNKISLASTLTMERMTQDGIELVGLLRELLGKDKVFLVGHSWGSVPGIHMVKARPDLFYAFVGTEQVADPAKTYAVAYHELVTKAAALGNKRALEELQEVGPPPYSSGYGYMVQRKWSNLFEGLDIFIASMLGLALGAPGYNLRDINEWFEGQSLSAEHLVPQTSVLGAEALGGNFDLPVIVIQGAEDFTTPTSLARAFVNSIRAPYKEFVAIPGAATLLCLCSQTHS